MAGIMGGFLESRLNAENRRERLADKVFRLQQITEDRANAEKLRLQNEAKFQHDAMVEREADLNFWRDAPDDEKASVLQAKNRAEQVLGLPVSSTLSDPRGQAINKSFRDAMTWKQQGIPDALIESHFRSTYGDRWMTDHNVDLFNNTIVQGMDPTPPLMQPGAQPEVGPAPVAPTADPSLVASGGRPADTGIPGANPQPTQAPPSSDKADAQALPVAPPVPVLRSWSDNLRGMMEQYSPVLSIGQADDVAKALKSKYGMGVLWSNPQGKSIVRSIGQMYGISDAKYQGDEAGYLQAVQTAARNDLDAADVAKNGAVLLKFVDSIGKAVEKEPNPLTVAETYYPMMAPLGYTGSVEDLAKYVSTLHSMTMKDRKAAEDRSRSLDIKALDSKSLRTYRDNMVKVAMDRTQIQRYSAETSRVRTQLYGQQIAQALGIAERRLYVEGRKLDLATIDDTERGLTQVLGTLTTRHNSLTSDMTKLPANDPMQKSLSGQADAVNAEISNVMGLLETARTKRKEFAAAPAPQFAPMPTGGGQFERLGVVGSNVSPTGRPLSRSGCADYVKDYLQANLGKTVPSLGKLPMKPKAQAGPGDVIYLRPNGGDTTQHWAYVRPDGSLAETINGKVSIHRTLDEVRGRIQNVRTVASVTERTDGDGGDSGGNGGVQKITDQHLNDMAGFLRKWAKDKTKDGKSVAGQVRAQIQQLDPTLSEWQTEAMVEKLLNKHFWGVSGRPKPGSYKKG